MAPRLALVKKVFAIHAVPDDMSYFGDVEQLAKAVNACDGFVDFLVVSDADANYDHRGRKRKSCGCQGHFYQNYSLFHDTSEEFLYKQLKRDLAEIELFA